MITHKFIPGVNSNKKNVITFNGTGADENDLVSFVKPLVNENTSILGLKGGYDLNRWVSTTVGMDFDLDEIKKDGEELFLNLKSLEEEYNFDLKTSTFLGFSNGANFILGLIYVFPQKISSAICMHCMKPFNLETRNDLKHLKVLITHGHNDQFASDSEIEELIEYFKSCDAQISTHFYDGDHFYVGAEEIEVVNNILKKY